LHATRQKVWGTIHCWSPTEKLGGPVSPGPHGCCAYAWQDMCYPSQSLGVPVPAGVQMCTIFLLFRHRKSVELDQFRVQLFADSHVNDIVVVPANGPGVKTLRDHPYMTSAKYSKNRPPPSPCPHWAAHTPSPSCGRSQTWLNTQWTVTHGHPVITRCPWLTAVDSGRTRCWLQAVSTSASDWLERLVSEMTDNNNNNHDDIYSAVIMTRSLREFTRFIWWM